VTREPDNETYRVIVFARDGGEIFLRRSKAGLHFPEVSILQCRRVAENVGAEMKKHWGVEIVCLFELPSPLGSTRARYMVAKHWRTSGNAVPIAQWIPLRDVSEVSFAEPDDHSIMRESFARCSVSFSDTDIGPFTRLNWFEELCQWVEGAIMPMELHLTGNFLQLSACPTFSLIRFETNGSAVWFKAVGAPNRDEFAITLKLAELLPNFLPTVVRARKDWNGWLAIEANGRELSATTDMGLWEIAAESLARLQIESLRMVNEVRASGARTLSTVGLSAVVRPFFDAMAQLMEQQTKMPPPILSKQEIRLLQERILDYLARLQDLGIPDALGHLDLNPGNIIVSFPCCTFLDWAEAYVGYPFFTFQYLLEHFRRTFGADSVTESRLIKAYAQRWEGVLASKVINEGLLFSPPLAILAYAAGNDTWSDQQRLKDHALAGYMRGLTRRMLREANLLSNRGLPCMS